MIDISQLQKMKQKSYSLVQLSNKQRNLFLSELIKQLRSHNREIFAANKKDCIQAYKKKLSDAFISRLQFGGHELDQLIAKIEAMRCLNAHLFEVIEQRRAEEGLQLQKMRVPIGVVFIIYESRPEVTVEAVCLSIKSGNGVILRGGSDALHTNKALYLCIKYALKRARIVDTVSFIEDCSHRKIYQLLQMNQYIDLVIARGGYDMVRDIQSKSKIPVLAHAAGGARIYADRSADLEMALRIILNAKLSKPAACNSVDTVLIDKKIAGIFLPKLMKLLNREGVRIYTGHSDGFWRREFLDKEIAIKIVLDYKQALKHIQNYTKGHTEGLVAQDEKVIDAFIHSVDTASLMINCSTRLHDGYMYGLGAEMGIATGKFHVRGPVGLEGLTTYKWIVKGSGQMRK